MTEEEFQRQELERQEAEQARHAFESEESKKNRRLESALEKLEVPLDVPQFLARMQQVREAHVENLRKIREAFDVYDQMVVQKELELLDLMIRKYKKQEG